MYIVNRKGENAFSRQIHTHKNTRLAVTVRCTCPVINSLDCLIHMNYTVRSHLIHTNRTGLQLSPDRAIVNHLKIISQYTMQYSQSNLVYVDSDMARYE